MVVLIPTGRASICGSISAAAGGAPAASPVHTSWSADQTRVAPQRHLFSPLQRGFLTHAVCAAAAFLGLTVRAAGRASPSFTVTAHAQVMNVMSVHGHAILVDARPHATRALLPDS
jgi:hypothetical protein